jgi:hypothetical protein
MASYEVPGETFCGLAFLQAGECILGSKISNARSTSNVMNTSNLTDTSNLTNEAEIGLESLMV